ncbi:MAG TPA: sensor histidine kinase [Clostridia bacterium]|nr:sensor histidine kinase [Clostridia bacterium]
MERGNRKRGAVRAPSLRWWLVSMVTGFWILPIMLFTGVMGYYAVRNLRTQMTDTVVTSVDNAVGNTANAVSSAMEASRASSYDRTVRDAYEAYIGNGDGIVLYTAVSEYLTRQYRYNDVFITTMLYFCESPDTVYYTNNLAHTNAYSNVRAYKENAHQTVINYAKKIGTDVRFLENDGRLYMIRNIVDSSFKPYAVIVMELDTDVLFQSAANVVWLKNASVRLGDAAVTLTGTGAVLPETSAVKSGISYVIKDNVYEVSAKLNVPPNDVVFAFEVDAAPFVSEISNFRNLILSMFVLAIPLMAVLIVTFYRYISVPVSSLLSAAEEIQKGKLGYRIEERPKSREFIYLTDSFNAMSKSMHEQLEKSRNEQIALQDARIKALQSQINPHFLNNTLEIINWEARMAGNLKVSHMIEALSTMLSAATARGTKSTVYLSEELSYVDAYLYIISVRLGKRLSVSREIDESLLVASVPQLVMQPVVENAIEHAIVPRQRGKLSIRAYQDGGDLVLEIENDGEMREADLSAIETLLTWDGGGEYTPTKSGSLGIRNVNQRIKILYGVSYGLTIENTPQKTTLARIRLPLIDGDKENA